MPVVFAINVASWIMVNNPIAHWSINFVSKGVSLLLTTPYLSKKAYVWNGMECKGIFFLSQNIVDKIHTSFAITTMGEKISVSVTCDEVNGANPQEIVDEFVRVKNELL
jgi:hypothetical protein